MNLQASPASVEAAIDTTAAPGRQPSFAEQVRGQEARQVDLTLAMIMSDLYEKGGGVDGWAPLDADELLQAGIDPATLRNDDTGFRARIYGDGDGHYVLAYCGTDESKDWLTNLRQGLGIDDAQYNQAIALAQEARLAFGDEVVITGHSLGGGLAAASSLVTEVPAVTFNAAGVHDNTIERFGLDAGRAKNDALDGLVRRYTVDNDILTELQEDVIPMRWMMPDAVGHEIELADPDPLSFWERLNPVNGIRHGIDVHYIGAVIRAQQLSDLYDRQARADAARSEEGAIGFDTRGALVAFQRARGLRPDGIAGPLTLAGLAEGSQAPLLSDPGHPEHALYRQSRGLLAGLDPATLGFAGDRELRNVAASLVLEARRAGLQQVDHVLPSANGTGFILVQGRLDDPAHSRLQVDRTQAVARSLEQSTTQLAREARSSRQDAPQKGPQPDPQERGQAGALLS